MFSVVRPVAPVLAGVVLLELALGALSPLIGLQLVRRHVATEVIGIVASAYFGGFLLGTLSCHRVIDRVGHIRAFSVFAVIAADATLLHAVIREPLLWIGLRAATGYALAGLFVIAESWLNDKATTENRGRIFALYMAASWAASGVGPLGLNIPDPDGRMLFTLTAIVLGTALIPMALTRIGNPEIGHRSHFGVRRLYRISPLGFTACFGAGLINTALWGLLPVYTEGSGLSPARLSVLLSTSVIGALLIQFPVGMLSDRFGRRPLMLVTTALAAGLAVAIVALGGRSFAVLLVLTFLLGSMVAPLYALGVGQTNDYVSRKDFVAASSGLLCGSKEYVEIAKTLYNELKIRSESNFKIMDENCRLMWIHFPPFYAMKMRTLNGIEKLLGAPIVIESLSAACLTVICLSALSEVCLAKCWNVFSMTSRDSGRSAGKN